MFVLICEQGHKGGSSGVSVCTPFIEKQQQQQKKKTGAWLIVWLQLRCRTSVLLAALRVELEQQAEGGEAEQEGLGEPHAASGHAVNALGSVKQRRGRVSDTHHTFTKKTLCRPARQRSQVYLIGL